MDTIIDIFETAARQHAERPALLIKPGFRTRIWTYADVGRLVPRVASVLRGAGVEPGDRVLIWAVGRPEWGISFLGTLFAGAVAVPLDARTTDELAAKVAAQTRPKLVLASMPTMQAASRLEMPTLGIEALVDMAGDSQPAPRPDVDPDSLAEIVFTSGTTGEPKGVMLSHRNIASNATAVRQVIPFGTDTRLLSILPLSHMYGLGPGFLVPMIAGGLSVYPTSLQSSVLARTFREQEVSMLLAVPQVLKLLTSAVERKADAGGKRATFERLHGIAPRLPLWARRILFRQVLAGFGGRFRYVAVGAAALNPIVARRWENMGVTALQGYGATEASPVISFTRVERNRIGTVGEPLPNVELRFAPDSEILVRGPNIFQGYWERPDATAEVLKDGWYHTGDLGKLEEDRFLVLHGRKKDMLALPDGTKVYPDDVEFQLSRDPRVREAAVVGLERADGELQVHAALIVNNPAEADEVVRTANSQLGAHQQIRGFTIWPEEDLPRTPSMKVKRSAVLDQLRVIRGEQPSAGVHTDVATEKITMGTGTDPTAPPSMQTRLERLLARLDGIDAEAIAPDARLSSDLGLDSLSRVELLTLVEEELGAYIDDGELDPETTVAELQAQIEQATGVRREEGIFGWPLNPVVGGIRIGIQQAVIQPLLSLFYRRRTRGLEHLDGIQGPVLFVANHHLHHDNALILCAIPVRWRWKLSVAAALDGIYRSRLRGFGASLLGNAFPLSREGAVRRSLDLLGARIDRGYSILIYPEGTLTVGGPMQPFKAGTGLVAIHGAISVVPIRLDVHRYSRIDRDVPATALEGKPPAAFRGDVEVVFGAPRRYRIDDDPSRVAADVQAAVEGLYRS